MSETNTAPSTVVEESPPTQRESQSTEQESKESSSTEQLSQKIQDNSNHELSTEEISRAESLLSKDEKDLTSSDVKYLEDLEKRVTDTEKQQKRLKRVKLKVDQKEFEEELPFEIPDDPESLDYITRNLQLAKMGQSRAQQYSQLEKEVKAFIEELKKDPVKILSSPEFGVDVKKLAAKVIEDEIAASQKSPEQLEKEKIESELKALKEEREKEKKVNEERDFERATEKAYEEYDKMITDALGKSDLPTTPYTIKKIADYMLLGLQEGYSIVPEDVIPLVKEEMHKDLKDMFNVMPDDVIEQLVGKDVLSRIRKRNVAKAKEAPPQPANKTVQDVGKASEKKVDDASKKSFREFFGV